MAGSAGNRGGLRCAVWLTCAIVAGAGMANPAADRATGFPAAPQDAAAEVDPFVGTLMTGRGDSGHTFPGAAMPFGMLQWSPENTKGVHWLPAAPGGYAYNTTRIRGFSLTHLSGTGCTGASGDVPFMPVTVPVGTSPSADTGDGLYASDFSHAYERASPGYYQVRLANGVKVELAAALRSGMGEFDFPSGGDATMLIRASDSELGSSASTVSVDAASRTVTGSVTSGYFCAYLGPVNRSPVNAHSYYTLYFVAQFSQPFVSTGVWHDGSVSAGASTASGGTYDASVGHPVLGRGAGAWVGFAPGSDVSVRVGISYVSLADARANLRAEIPRGTTVATVERRARDAWDRDLDRIVVSGGTPRERRTFYTAMYHSLLQPNTFSDANGQYRGLDQKIHRIHAGQSAQYANFSGWDVYRSQFQLLAWLFPDVASDIGQSLLNQARQSGGVWYRWTHEAGGLTVMNGDPAGPAIADLVAFGGGKFDVAAAYRSLKHAATHVTPADLSSEGCGYRGFHNNHCIGERPSLDQWMKLHYIASESHSGAGAAESLEDATADFALSRLAASVGDTAGERLFLARSGYWRNLFNPRATPEGGYVQDRRVDGMWPGFDPRSEDGFVEGTAAQYVWMVPFDVGGLFAQMGGSKEACARLHKFFHTRDGGWALTQSGPLHAELDNEPSYLTPWLFDYCGEPDETQATVRAAVNTLWAPTPGGIPGEDDLGETSSWYVWAALGLYPAMPGRAELLIASPLFPHVVVRRPDGDVVIDAPGAATGAPYVQSLTLDGTAWAEPWLPASFVHNGGTLHFVLTSVPDRGWGRGAADAPPSFAAGPEDRGRHDPN